MKPNPLSSLNHFTVPVGMVGTPPRYVRAATRRMLLRASTCESLHCFRRSIVPARHHDRSRSQPPTAVETSLTGRSGIRGLAATEGGRDPAEADSVDRWARN